MVLRVGFGVRLSRRLLRLRYLPVRRGQIALGLRDVLPGLRQVRLRLSERLGGRILSRLGGLDVLLRLRQSRLVIGNRLVRGGQTILISLDVSFRRRKLFSSGILSRLGGLDVLLRLRQFLRIVGQSLLSLRQIRPASLDISLRLFQLFRRISQSRLVRGNRLVRLSLLIVNRILSGLVILNGLAQRFQRRISGILLFLDGTNTLSVLVDFLRRGIQVGTQLGLLLL